MESQSSIYKDKQEGEPNKDETSSISTAILVMISLLVLNALVLNHLSKLKQRGYAILRYINPTIVTTVIGLIAGFFLRLVSEKQVIEDFKQGFSEIFLIVLLPPILFESAINMEKQLFFKHFGTILIFAIFGTGIAAVITSLLVYFVGVVGLGTGLSLTASFAFGSLISATDPVAVLSIFKELNADQMLYIIIFGESILNDAVSIILYDTMAKVQTSGEQMGFGEALLQFLLVFFGSFIIGYIIGIICAYVIFDYNNLVKILKKKDRHSQETIDHIEATITLLVPWVSYLIAQAASLSGIVSIMFCGIAMARYALPNLSDNGKRVPNAFKLQLAYESSLPHCGIYI